MDWTSDLRGGPRPRRRFSNTPVSTAIRPPQDTLTQLAVAYHTTASQIKMLNNILGNDLDLLPPDTVLLIPRYAGLFVAEISQR